MGLLLLSALILWVVHRWEPVVVENYRLRRLHLKVHQRSIHDADAFILHELCDIYFRFYSSENKNRNPLGELRKKSFSLVTWEKTGMIHEKPCFLNSSQ